MTVEKTPMYPKYRIFLEALPCTSVIMNRKNVIEIQYIELKKVACYLVLKSFNTA